MNARIRSALWGAMLGATMVVALPTAQAQSTEGAKSLSGGGGSGPLMTREELRACMKRQAAIGPRRDELEAERAKLVAEKAEIVAETDALKKEGGTVSATGDEVSEINAKTNDLARRVADWNTRFQAFEKEQKSGPFAEIERRKLKREQAELQAEQETLDSQRASMGNVQGNVADYNERATALEKKVVAWNTRNAALATASEAAARERDLWADECGNRRYLIDDEKAINAGQ